VSDQAIQRASQLPEQLLQRVIIDIRGQTVNPDQQQDIADDIVRRANGAIDPKSVRFKGED